MMIQEITIGLLFAGAGAYLYRMFRRSFNAKEGACPKGCGCSKIDFKDIEARISADSRLK
ncbi:MAG: hypothetical protein ACJ75J_16365 [Cytophagaceae bacterium]